MPVLAYNLGFQIELETEAPTYGAQHSCVLSMDSVVRPLNHRPRLGSYHITHRPSQRRWL